MKKSKEKRQDMEVLNDKLGKYVQGEAELCKKLKITRTLCFNFPERKRIPILSKIALKIIRSQGGIIDMRFTQIK